MQTFSPRLQKIFLSLFGIGYIPFFPGTLGSLFSLGLLLGFFSLFDSPLMTFWGLIIIFFIVYFVALFCIKKHPLNRSYDHSWIVIDEFLGMVIALMPLVGKENKIFYGILGFIIFRFFDILKPAGIQKIDQKKTPQSVVWDDLLAGFYSAVLLGGIIFFRELF